MTTPRVFIIEGLDRLGKSTLIDGLLNYLGYYEVVHFSKPKNLAIYDGIAAIHSAAPVRSDKHESQFLYQQAGFQNMMQLVVSKAHLIFDRAHLGEFVYSPLYRGYQGDYVFDLEKVYGLGQRDDVRLILLTEDMDIASHFVDDGQSLGPVQKRREEQTLFVKAFHRSCIRDKRIISVTDPGLGGFKPKDWILKEALA